MNNEQNRENFAKCLAYIRERLPLLGGRPLCIGYGDADYSHPWNEKEFQGRKCSLQINNDSWHGKDVLVETYGGYYMQHYGYEKSEIEKRKASYKGTGMAYPDNDHTWDELDVVPFLLDWQHIKHELDSAVSRYNSLDDFKV